MADKVLSQKERMLCFFAVIVVTASIAMALCIGLILPPHWTKEGYISNASGKSLEELIEDCQCGRRRLATNCIPRAFSQRVLTTTTEKVAPRDFVQNYPYLVSLHAPAYIDDKKERRLACSGTILTKAWILIGGDCVQDENELKWLRIRAGSTYWSKGGTKHTPKAFAKLKDGGAMALKVHPPFTFGKFTNAVRLQKKGVYTAWISAACAGWQQNNKRRYNKFAVQRWTTIPCTGGCLKGRVETKPSCGSKIIGTALVAERSLLIGLLGAVCFRANRSEYSYIDVQTEEYTSWFDFLADRSDRGEKVLQPLDRALDNTTATAKPLKIYEMKECAGSDANLPEDAEAEDYSPGSSDEATQKSKVTKTTSFAKDAETEGNSPASSEEATQKLKITETTFKITTINIRTTWSDSKTKGPRLDPSTIFLPDTQETTDSNPSIFPTHVGFETESSRVTESVSTQHSNPSLFDWRLYHKVPSEIKKSQAKDEKVEFRKYPKFEPQALESERKLNSAVLGTHAVDEYGEVLKQKLVIPLRTTVGNLEHHDNGESSFLNKEPSSSAETTQVRNEKVGFNLDPAVDLGEFTNANRGYEGSEADVTNEYQDVKDDEILEQTNTIPLFTFENVENNGDDGVIHITDRVLIEPITMDISNNDNYD